MASDAKAKEGGIGGALLLLVLAAALAVGGGHGLSIGNGGPGGGSWRDPCMNEPRTAQLGTVTGPDGKTYSLLCGSVKGRIGGWRHMRVKHIADGTDVSDVLACISKTLANGAKTETATTDTFKWTWDAARNRSAVVYIDFTRGTIRNALAGTARDWAKCASR